MFQWQTLRDLLQIPWNYVKFLLVSMGLDQFSEGLNSCLLLLFYSQNKYFYADEPLHWMIILWILYLSLLSSVLCESISVQHWAFILTSNPDCHHDCCKFNIEIFLLCTLKEPCDILHILSFNILMIDFFIFLATVSKALWYSREFPWKYLCWIRLHI